MKNTATLLDGIGVVVERVVAALDKGDVEAAKQITAYGSLEIVRLFGADAVTRRLGGEDSPARVVARCILEEATAA